MIRRLILTVALLAVTTAFLPATSASAASAAQVCTQPAKHPAGVKALIQCVAPRLGVSTSKALSIAWRESHYQPGAQNPYSSACGVYQFVSGTWSAVVRLYLYGHALGPVSCTNGRMNVFLAMRYVRHGGWGPWGG